MHTGSLPHGWRGSDQKAERAARAHWYVGGVGGILLRVLRVSDPIPKGRGLGLDSTATLSTFSGAQLWLHRPIHRGLPTKAPSPSSLAG